MPAVIELKPGLTLFGFTGRYWEILELTGEIAGDGRCVSESVLPDTYRMLIKEVRGNGEIVYDSWAGDIEHCKDWVTRNGDLIRSEIESGWLKETPMLPAEIELKVAQEWADLLAEF